MVNYNNDHANVLQTNLDMKLNEHKWKFKKTPIINIFYNMKLVTAAPKT